MGPKSPLSGLSPGYKYQCTSSFAPCPSQRSAICIRCCLLPLFPGNHRVLYLHCHVFWPLPGHLQAPLLPHHYDQQPLTATCPQLLGGRLYHRLLSDATTPPVAILWQQCHQSFLLWCWSHFESSLHRHKHFGAPGSFGDRPGDPRVTPLHSDFLYLYPVHHPTDPFSHWPTEDFLDLCLPPDSSLPALWCRFVHVPETHSTLFL